MKNRLLKSIGYLIFLLSFFVSANAQTFNLQSIPSDRSQFGFKFLRPSLGSNVDWSMFSGIYELSFTSRPSSGFHFMLNIPYINVDYEIDYGFSKRKFNERSLGNIFIGLQNITDTTDNVISAVTFGLYLPSVSEEVTYYGIITDYCKFQKYIPNTYTIYFNFAHHKFFENGLTLGLNLGPSIAIPNSNSNAEQQIYINYGISVAAKAQQLVFNVDLFGLGFLTGHVDKFKDRFTNIFGLGIGWQEKTFMPKFYYNIYLDEVFEETVDGVFGFEMQYWTN